jgi:hypothetical protein
MTGDQYPGLCRSSPRWRHRQRPVCRCRREQPCCRCSRVRIPGSPRSACGRRRNSCQSSCRPRCRRRRVCRSRRSRAKRYQGRAGQSANSRARWARILRHTVLTVSDRGGSREKGRPDRGDSDLHPHCRVLLEAEGHDPYSSVSGHAILPRDSSVRKWWHFRIECHDLIVLFGGPGGMCGNASRLLWGQWSTADGIRPGPVTEERGAFVPQKP